MKITSVKTLCLSRRHEPERQWVTASFRTVKADCAIVIIDTDAGVRGIAEPSAYGDPPRIRDRVAALAGGLIGRDPLDPGLAPRPTGEDRSDDIPLAGIDCALWDLRARIAGQPVSALLAAAGGPATDPPRTRVRLYASGGVSYDWNDDPGQLVRETLAHAAAGYTAFKMRVGTEWSRSNVTTARMISLLWRVTDAAAGRMELMLDGNCRLTEAESHAIAGALDQLGWTWFEEPMPRDPAAYARLNRAANLPITGGEAFTRAEQFDPYLEAGALAIVQPDVGVCGIGEWLRIVERADRCGVDVCPHSWHNGLMAVAHAHAVAALPRPRVLELCMVQGPLQWGILREPPAIEDGHLALPAGPGWGVELADGLEERFPYLDGHYSVPLDGPPAPSG